jgi:hypothetical protein
MTFSLPAPRILYQARTATEWKACFYNQKILSAKVALKLVDIARDPGLLEDLGTDVDAFLLHGCDPHFLGPDMGL